MDLTHMFQEQKVVVAELTKQVKRQEYMLASWDKWYTQWSGFMNFLWKWFSPLFWALKKKDDGDGNGESSPSNAVMVI